MSALTLPARCTPIGLDSVPIAFRKIVRFARKEGWVLGKDGNNHVNLIGPNGARVMLSGSGKMNGRRHKNYLADLRRAGVPGA